jgi:hypothetical protein
MFYFKGIPKMNTLVQNRKTALVFLTLFSLAGADLSAQTAERTPGGPASVDEAAKIIDLSKLPLMKGAEKPLNARFAAIFYQAPGKVKDVFDFHRKQLIEKKWKELPGAYVSDQSSTATFEREGYRLSLTAFPSGKAGESSVTITNHGNVPLDKLPLPKGAKSLYAGPSSSMFVVDTPQKETAEACKKLLMADGWTPYGTAGDTQFFKKNAIRLSAFITAAPAQGGKTSIQYSTELLSADLPAPADPINLQYSDTQLSFDTNAAQKDIADFYRKTLEKSGWKATTDAPIQIDFRHELIFRNPVKDMLTLQFTEVEGKRRILLRWQSAAEVAELERLAKAEIERCKAEKNKPLPKLAVTIPAGATELQEAKNRLEFKLPAGKAKAVVDAWRKKFAKDDWKESAAVLEDMAGSISLDKGDRHLTITYTDTGFMPAEITIQATGAELEKAAEKP